MEVTNLSKITRTSSAPRYLWKIVTVKSLARSEQVLIQSSFSSASTSAIPSTMETLICPSALANWSLGSACSTDLSLGSFSRILINAFFAEQCSILPSAANIDRGTTENSYPQCLFDVYLRTGLADYHHPREETSIFL